ncbi:MAG TPA: hypothetical protein VGE46_04775 [Bdellovibrio sp.]
MKKLTVVPLLFLAMTSMAQAENKLLWHSVVESETKAMRCSVLTPPSEKDMKSFLEARVHDPDEKMDQTVLGVNFKDENPQMIKWFTGVHDIPHVKRADASGVHLADTRCDKVVCALEKNYGSGMALRMLYLYAKFGLASSALLHREHTSYQKWNLSEVNDLLVGLESTPPSKIPFKNRHILRVKDGFGRKSKAREDIVVLANASMEYFDHWSRQDSVLRIQSVVHEVGHLIGADLDESQEWKNTPSDNISKYALTNPAEAFAEAYTAYRIAPKKLKASSPQAYAYFKKNVFSGLEFKSSDDCEDAFAKLDNETARVFKMRWKNAEWISKSTKEINEELERVQKFGILTDLALQYCTTSYLAEKNGGDREKTMQCLTTVFQKRAAVIEARERGDEDVSFENIRSSLLSSLPVPRHAVLALRAQMRTKIGEELQAFYSQRGLEYFVNVKDAILLTNSDDKEDSAFIRQNRSLVAPLVLEVFQQEAPKFFLRRLFAPSFLPVLP